MAYRVLSRGLVLVAALALSFPAWAAPVKKTIHVQRQLHVGDATLSPGDYTIKVDGNEATFERGNKVVAKVPCTVQDTGTKNSQDAVIYGNYGNGAIIGILLARRAEVVTFAPVTSSTPSKSSSTTSGDR